MRHFDETRYLAEMHDLLARAVATLAARHPNLAIYTLSIWTDPDAGSSAVNVDTAANAAARLAEGRAWAAEHYARLIAEGDLEQARLFAPTGEGRHCNPADFALRELVTVDHQSMPAQWEERSHGACWDALEPALLRVRDDALQRFGGLCLHPDAELAVNSRADWYDHPVPLRASAT